MSDNPNSRIKQTSLIFKVEIGYYKSAMRIFYIIEQQGFPMKPSLSGFVGYVEKEGVAVYTNYND